MASASFSRCVRRERAPSLLAGWPGNRTTRHLARTPEFVEGGDPHVLLPLTVVTVLPLRHRSFPADIVPPPFAFDPLVALDLLLLGPEDFKQGGLQTSLADMALPFREVLLVPLLAGLLPPDVAAGLLALDPSVFFNLLSLGSNQLSQRTAVLGSILHFEPPLLEGQTKFLFCKK